ncbi:MAG: VapB-type antitoxin [Thermoproteota archaeon]|nr:VapB-type antitoxin [Candidatus Korarchaeota archaeon]RLG40771.1 MAG: VapB-type antitoxin [Candidatus Korarchaeota archaeon]
MGVNVSEEVRNFLEELAWKARIRKKIEEWRSILNRTKPSEKGFSIRSVREDRDSH